MLTSLKEIIKVISEGSCTLTDTGVIKQTERNTMRNDILNALLDMIPTSVDIVKGRTTKGVLLAIDNEKGYIPIYIDVKISKMFDSDNEYFDPLAELEEFKEKQLKSQERKKTQISFKKVG